MSASGSLMSGFRKTEERWRRSVRAYEAVAAHLVHIDHPALKEMMAAGKAYAEVPDFYHRKYRTICVGALWIRRTSG